MPTEEEVEFAPPVRVLKTVATVVLPVALVASVHLRVFAALSGDTQAVGRLMRIAGVMAFAMVLLSIAMVVRLRVEGLDLKSILLKAFRQPNWWRAWYPRPLRQRGDVWDRLPRTMRQYRTFKGMALAYIWALFMPLQFMSLWLHLFSALTQVLFLGAMGGIAFMFALRNRAVKDIRGRVGGPVPEAAALLNTPTWRTAVWRRTPTASLLIGQPPGSTVYSRPSAAEQPTQLS